MAVWNLGSINIDHFYRVSHLPHPGETIAAAEYRRGLGGKGANMSVAAARCAARVHHIGAVGAEGLWARDRLLEYGVDTRYILQVGEATGHASIVVNAEGENQITLYTGANGTISDDQIGTALSAAAAGDTFVTQNETNAQRIAGQMAKDLGLRVVYAAAPFEVSAAHDMLDITDLLVLNQVEAEQLETALGVSLRSLPVPYVVITLGADGCRVIDTALKTEDRIDAVPVEAVDTSGAGDVFSGYLIAALDRGMTMRQGLSLANRAAALMVTRVGTADVIPDLKDIEDWRLG